ncbi:ABC transporter permease [Patescibacteria group bacterium]|nr:ABC transporter permease [Patescibacteria group bacterium]
MKPVDYITTAQTNLGRSKARTILTVFAIVIGTFTLAMTTAFGQGVQQIINLQLQAYTSPNLVFVTVASGSQSTPGTIPPYQPGRQTTGGEGHQPSMNQHDIDVIKTMPYVSAAYPNLRVSADYIQYGAGKYLISLAGLYPGSQVSPVSGSLPDQNSSGIILPYPYIQTFGASSGEELLGKTVTVHLTNQADPNKQEDVKMAITGFLADTVHTPDAFIPVNNLTTLADFQSNNKPVYSEVAAVTSQPLSTGQDQALKNALSAHGYSGLSYLDTQNNFRRPLQIVKYGLSGFAGVALLAAAIGIVNTLLMAVFERTQEIGLLKALGMRRRGIFTLFIAEALAIGFWGGVIGVGLAVIFGRVANNILVHGIFRGVADTHLLVFPIAYMAAIIGGAMLLGVIAGTLPALRASRLDPIEALRRE